MSTWAPGSVREACAAARTALLALACLLCACAVGPDFKRPQAPAATHYAPGSDPVQTVAAQGAAQRMSSAEKVVPDWWRLFRSPALDAVVAEALAGNPGIEAAQASLRQSEDTLRSGYGIFFPDIAVGAAASRQRVAPEKIGVKAPATIFNLFTLSASASYALDLFGGERRMVEALHAQVDVQRATEQATYLTLIANIVNTVIASAAYRAEIEATQQLIELQRQQVKLTEVQWHAGIVPYANALLLQTQLASNEATVAQYQQRLAQSEDLLATLTGHVPAEWQSADVRLSDLTLPQDLPVSLPSELVRQRPDILAAESTAHAASANVGVATAAMLPSITLSGTYSANGTGTGTVFSSAGRAWDVGANLTAPLFEGGTLWFRRKAAIDSYQQAMALYRQVVLGAFGQVADTLRALENDAVALRAQDAALSSAKEALHLVQINYQAGLSTYLEVLIADEQYHQAITNDLQATAVRYQDTVALYVALGGGWWSQGDTVPPGSYSRAWQQPLGQ
ncbi:MAG TPA: efflux transporter outer membrane subunit [Steroidobacteraceae bacterium]|nr:efflux transporter outer membrane subunit [Steroidobacteraceae bacterium]